MRTSADEMTKGTALDRAAFEKSVRDMFAAIEDGFGLAGRAIRDPRIRKDLSNVADSVRQALLATVESAGEQVRERLPRVPAERSPKSTVRKVSAQKSAARNAAPVKKAAPARKATAGRNGRRKRTAS